MFYNYFLDLSKEEFTNDMIQLDKSNLDQGLPTATKLIHIVNKPAEIFTLLQNKQQQTDGFLEDSPVDNISSSKDPSSFPFCDEAYKFVKRTLGPFPPFSRLLSYLHKRGTRYC